MIDKQCVVCGNKYEARRGTSRYCSSKCKDRAKHLRTYIKSSGKPVLPAVDCKTCGESFQPKPGGYNAAYCSMKCHPKNDPPEYDSEYRKRGYLKIKADPELYARHLKSGAAARKLTREWLSQYKQERGCCDCGYNVFPCALQLDHEGYKSVEIADARSSISRLKEEIEKGQCVVRCANCHSVKTWAEKNKIPYIPGMAQGLGWIPSNETEERSVLVQ